MTAQLHMRVKEPRADGNKKTKHHLINTAALGEILF